MLTILLVIVLLVLLFGAMPGWGRTTYGEDLGPLLWVLIVVVIILAVFTYG